jgi:hypothetical protein
MLPSSVIVDQLDILGTTIGPTETNPVLVVDPNAVLTFAISGKLLQSVPRRNSKVFNIPCRIDHQQFPPRPTLDVRPEAADIGPFENRASGRVPEASNYL